MAVLHDVVKDAGRSTEDLRRLRYSEDVLAAPDCVTNRDGEDYAAFVERAAANPVARRVKLADLEDNLDLRRVTDVGPRDAQRLARYVKAWHRLKHGS